ncbi:TonB-dependent receptor [Novosphingobium album (ex Liu et al. 2023)]|uniref:TonB-dependent receptor n=1 Tax=Novosphingobium album (ex Liu et al. 2023) TaxID=3031130 RepID=A0ABT5WKY7_9SPHN|nr:TonB-dependent receptor [Novosphingobium album (ex Liu et al. 2023)]MDE8650707.1 TonB-dependent receptor [Novosphingobium album (ex Liu et al. 2023)]
MQCIFLGRLRRSTAIATVLVCGAWSCLASAQTTADPVEPALTDDRATVADEGVEGEEIVVTGVRGSLARALNQKRTAAGIVDGISAKDLMDYPDLNIADSLQRITGVTVERSLGEATNIAVRGLASQFTRVTINGQTVTSGNSGREVSFDVFASELFTNVQIHKSHMAEQTEGGLAGTVDLRTARPFDYKSDRPVLGVSAQAQYNDVSKDIDPRLSAIVSKTFADGTIGVLASVSYSEQSLRQDNAEGLRFILTDIDADGDGVRETRNVEYPFIPRYVNENIHRKRLGITGAMQFRPADSFQLNFDVAYANVKEMRRRYSIDGQIVAANIQNPLSPPTVDATGLIVSADLPNVESRSENVQTPYQDKLLLLNADAQWDAADNLAIKGKVGYSDASRTTDEFRSTWSSFGAFHYDFTDRIFPVIEGIGRDILDPANYASHVARFINTDVTDREFSVQGDVEWRLGTFLSALKAGGRFNDGKKDTVQFDGTVRTTANFRDYAIDLPTDHFFKGESAPGIIRNWPVVDFDNILNSTALIPAGYEPPQRLISTNAVKEKTWAGYFQAEFDAHNVSSLPLRGNVGVRVVNTEQSSTGYPTSVSPITVSSTYTEVLPSANVTAELASNLMLRLGVAKSLTRPTITDLTPGGTVAVGVNMASFGNPFLKPYTAWNYDASLEWYFSNEALLSLALFDKEVSGFVTRVSSSETLGADVLGASDPRAGQVFDVSRPVNGDSAYVRGFEIGLQAPLSSLIGRDSFFSDFGFVANYTYADSKSTISFNGEDITTLLRGQSRSSVNAVVYYEKGPFSTRFAYSWRDKYLDEVRGGRERNNFIGAYGQLDMNVQYSITDKIVLTFNALNLLNEGQHRYAETEDRSIRFSNTGRFFLLGARAKF